MYGKKITVYADEGMQGDEPRRNSYNAHIHATARHNLADGLLGRLHSAKVSLDGVAGLLPLFASSGPFLRPLYHYILNNAKLKNTNKSQRCSYLFPGC